MLFRFYFKSFRKGDMKYLSLLILFFAMLIYP